MVADLRGGPRGEPDLLRVRVLDEEDNARVNRVPVGEVGAAVPEQGGKQLKKNSCPVKIAPKIFHEI